MPFWFMMKGNHFKENYYFGLRSPLKKSPEQHRDILHFILDYFQSKLKTKMELK